MPSAPEGRSPSPAPKLLLVVTLTAGVLIAVSAISFYYGIEAAAALVSVVVALAEMTGLLKGFLKVVKAHLPALAVAAAGIVLGMLASERRTLLEIENHLEQDRSQSLESLRADLDPNMERVFGDYVSLNLRIAHTALTERSIDLGSDLAVFRDHYQKTLHAFPQAHFLATSLPYERFFWNARAMQMMQDFVSHGGHVTRVFFVKPDEMADPSIHNIMDRQAQMGIEVYFVDPDAIDQRLYRLFLFDDAERIGWEVTTRTDGSILSTKATTNPARLREYRELWNELMDSGLTHRYRHSRDPGVIGAARRAVDEGPRRARGG